MGRILIQGFLLIALFLGIYGVMKQIDWMDLLHVKENADKTEKKLGEMLWKVFRQAEKETGNKQVLAGADSILTRLCEGNGIDRKNIKLHILEKSEVNAFALPDGHLVVYTGLIASAESPEEVAGVFAHELAHIELDHVMKKLVKEIGLSVLISATAGAGGAEVLKEAARMLSSSAFDRKLEKEADIKAVDYMIDAGIDPVPFGEFLYKLGGKGQGMEEYLSWLSTHPDSRERGEYVIEYAEERSFDTGPVMADETWEGMREGIQKGE